jgi:hypothetical protein
VVVAGDADRPRQGCFADTRPDSTSRSH